MTVQRMFTAILLVFGTWAVVATSATASVIQSGGRTYLGVEAENHDAVSGTRWLIVDTTPTTFSPPFTGTPSIPSMPILPGNTNASGGEALLANFTGSTSTASYDMTFNTAGTYYVYVRYSLFDAGNGGNFSSEDSIFLTGAFGTPIDTSTNIYDLPMQGHGTPGDGFWEGNFHWHQVQFRGASSLLSYDVQPADLGNVLTLEMRTRESGATIDYILLSTESGLTEAQLAGFIPEPASGIMLLGGGLGLALASLRRRRRARRPTKHIL